jgi:predicted porin
MGALGELDVGYVCGRDFDISRSAMFARGKFYIAATDLSVMFLGFRENLLIGLDAARSIGGAGAWFEAAAILVDAFDDDERNSADDYFQMSIGMDYSPWTNAYTYAEYHFNGAGAASTDNYVANTRQTAYSEGSVYLLGRHYLGTGISHQLTPLTTLGIDMLANLGDRSAYLTPRIEYNVQENLYLSGGAYIGIGREAIDMFKVRSEFRWYPDIFYGSLRLYF